MAVSRGSDPLQAAPDFAVRSQAAAAGAGASSIPEFKGVDLSAVQEIPTEEDEGLPLGGADKSAVTFIIPEGNGSAVRFGEPPASTPDPEPQEVAYVCEVQGTSSGGMGYSVRIATLGSSDGSYEFDRDGTLYVPDLALDATLPSGTLLIGHKCALAATGGND